MLDSFYKRGLGLIEALVAIAVLSVVSSAIILLTLQTLSLTASSKLKNQGSSFANQTVEQIRGYYKANGWSALSGWGKPGPRCFVSLWNGPSFGTCPDDSCTNDSLKVAPTSLFYRYFTVNTSANFSVTISSAVTWLEKGVCKKTNIETTFFNY